MIVAQRKYKLRETVFEIGKTNDRKRKMCGYFGRRRWTCCVTALTNVAGARVSAIDYRSSSSQGFRPVCFLKAVEKCEIQEYPIIIATSETERPFSYKRPFAFSILSFWK